MGTMVDYARIIVRVGAPESEVNGPNELKLSDSLGEVEEDLKAWLDTRLAGTSFVFDVKLR